MRKFNLFIAIICGLIFFVSIFALFFNKAYLNTANGIIQIMIGAISFALTLVSTNILLTELSQNCHCSEKDIVCGAKKIANDINNYNSDKIIYVDGNSHKLFNGYIEKYITSHYVRLVLPAQNRCIYTDGVFTESILTGKFCIGITTKFFSPTDKILIFDDVSKTGETVHKIKDFLIDTCKLPTENILTCGFIVDKYGYTKHSEPAFYYRKTEVKDEYMFKWRKQ